MVYIMYRGIPQGPFCQNTLHISNLCLKSSTLHLGHRSDIQCIFRLSIHSTDLKKLGYLDFRDFFKFTPHYLMTVLLKYSYRIGMTNWFTLLQTTKFEPRKI